jgi:hypothetical protein
VDNCEKRLDRAKRLIGGLGGEKQVNICPAFFFEHHLTSVLQRWINTISELNQSYTNTTGDILLSAVRPSSLQINYQL